MKVAVVGAGVMGCATAWALRERGAEVTVHEQFELDHDRGSSHGRTRIFRVAYPEPDWVRFAQEAYAGWQELDPSLLGLYGLIELVADPRSRRPARSTSAACRTGCSTGTRCARTARSFPTAGAALHVADAGVVFADRARHAFLEAAGVEVETNRRDRVDRRARRGRRRRHRRLVGARPRPRRAGEGDARDASPTSSAKARRRRRSSTSTPRPAATGCTRSTTRCTGSRPARTTPAQRPTPTPRRAPDPAIVERISAWVRERFPDVDPEPVEAQTCLYTTTADEHFILERRGRVVVGSACSGHGFKFAPAVGRRLAELALS